jgi:hypothetical protein
MYYLPRKTAMDIEEKDYEGYVRRIDQIDRILVQPIESLVDVVVDNLDQGAQSPGFLRRSLPIPSSVFGDAEAGTPPNRLNDGLCCSTLQRIWLQRRRFPKLGTKLEVLEKELKKKPEAAGLNVLELLAEPFLPTVPTTASLGDLAKIVGSREAGLFEPYTASQVFWVLLNAGERNAHTAVGFCAFFSIFWALFRRRGRFVAASFPPTSYVTAKCLAPLLSLRAICRQRAELLENIERLLGDLKKLMEHPASARPRQWLPLRLDELSGKLYELSTIAVNREGFRACAERIEEIADPLHSESEPAEPWANVLESLVQALRGLGTDGDQGLSEVQQLVEGKKGLPALVNALAEKDPTKRQRKLGKLRIPGSPPPFPTASEATWEEFVSSAEDALKLCQSTFKSLDRVIHRCSQLPAVGAEDCRNKPDLLTSTLDTLLGPHGLLRDLAKANREVEGAIETGTSEALQWCNVVLEREVAHASAKNLTEFDPAELLSSLFVTVSSRRIESPLLVSDAVRKALVGFRDDGSWVPGQPFFVKGELGLWAPTSDIVWMLSSTIARKREVGAADDALLAYVDWLERTRKTLSYRSIRNDSTQKRIKFFGWISERNLRGKRIDLWATTFAVNALLSIRELMEFRLWELCEKRFTVLDPSDKLSKIDAVDLGATHQHRLHRRLARMAREAVGDGYKKAEYSLILHGPPGSSKTAITGALATEMWRSPSSEGRRPRLIRITPADFTRKGADRLDSEARIIFDVLCHVRRITVLFDEIDDLLRKREKESEASFFQLVVPAMLNRLQDLRDACPKQEICFVLATNYVDRIEPALIRKGRIDGPVPLVYPDRESRRCTLGRHSDRLRDAQKAWSAALLEDVLGRQEISKTDCWPWQAFDTLCKEAALALVPLSGLPGDEQRARERIDQALSRGKVGVPMMIYSQRLAPRPVTGELREELLHYHLAGAADVTTLLDRVFEDVKRGVPPGAGGLDWSGTPRTDGKVNIQKRAADYLSDTLGGDLLEKLNRLATNRGWDQVNWNLE